MKIDHYLKKLEKTESFKKFKQEDPKAYLCSFFIIRDFEENHNETQADFYSPKSKKIISFKFDKKVERIPLDKKAETLTHKKFIPKPLGEKIKLEIEELKPTIIDEMHNRGLTDNIKKILVILQNMDDRDVWNCHCFLNGMALLQAHIEDTSESVLFMERKSFLDMMKFVSGFGPSLDIGTSENVGKKEEENKKVEVKEEEINPSKEVKKD